MSTTVFIAVIAAAALHAVWNAFAKGGHDKHLSMTAVVLGHTPIALAILAIVPMPAPESWPYLLGGIVLHTGYQLFLLAAYRIGDLTQVYPIARGTAPLIVAGVSIVFLGVELAPLEIVAVLTIAAGILSLSLVRQSDGLRNGKASMLGVHDGLLHCCLFAGRWQRRAIVGIRIRVLCLGRDRQQRPASRLYCDRQARASRSLHKPGRHSSLAAAHRSSLMLW